MARAQILLLALIFIAVVGVAYAADEPAAAPGESEGSAASPGGASPEGAAGESGSAAPGGAEGGAEGPGDAKSGACGDNARVHVVAGVAAAVVAGYVL